MWLTQPPQFALLAEKGSSAGRTDYGAWLGTTSDPFYDQLLLTDASASPTLPTRHW